MSVPFPSYISRFIVVNGLLNVHSENFKLCNVNYESMAKRFNIKDVTLLPYSSVIRIYLSKCPKQDTCSRTICVVGQ